jgi:hypothetical protein
MYFLSEDFMKLQTPEGFTGDVHLHGRSFVVDDKGQVDIEPEFIGSQLWAHGFTVAPLPETKTKPATVAAEKGNV